MNGQDAQEQPLNGIDVDAAPVAEEKRRGSGGRKLAESKAVLETNAAKRLRSPVVVTGVEMARTITVIPHRDFGKLNVDERYQRVRIGGEVNDLIHVLRAGGEIPDPVDIAERPDGTWWIVDGQQRFWAHDETQMSLRAMIHKVESLDAEKRLFVVLNSRRKVTPKVIVKGWPGVTGDFLRRLNTQTNSPLRGLIDFGNNTQLPIEATAFAKGVLAVTTGMVNPGGDTATMLLPRTDAALKVTGRMAWAEAYANLVAAVFGAEKNIGRVRAMPMRALADVAHQRYSEAGRPIFPRTCQLIRRINWDTCVPKHTQQYYPMMVARIQRAWRK